MTNEATTTTEAAAAADQGAQVAPKPATRTRKASPAKGAPKGKKTAKKATPKKAATKKTTKPATKASAAGRANSKKATILDMLRRKDGATVDELMAATGWQRHSCRGFLSTASKSFKIISEKTDAGRRYRIAK